MERELLVTCLLALYYCPSYTHVSDPRTVRCFPGLHSSFSHGLWAVLLLCPLRSSAIQMAIQQGALVLAVYSSLGPPEKENVLPS
jgi:hypothetical protein